MCVCARVMFRLIIIWRRREKRLMAVVGMMMMTTVSSSFLVSLGRSLVCMCEREKWRKRAHLHHRDTAKPAVIRKEAHTPNTHRHTVSVSLSLVCSSYFYQNKICTALSFPFCFCCYSLCYMLLSQKCDDDDSVSLCVGLVDWVSIPATKRYIIRQF